jgi:tetratricopeptide (TPR) repeat protein
MNTKTSKNTVLAVIIAIALMAFLMLSITAKSQSKKPVTTVPENINMVVYRQSSAIGDVNMAITSLHYLIASDPSKYGNWQDTLATLYLHNNEYQQAWLLSDALIKGIGYTDLRMEIKAVSAKALQQPVEAITDYTTLYGKTSNPVFGFEQMQLEYGIHRLNETIVTGNSLMQSATADKYKQVNVARADGKSVQQVTLKAAVANIMGLAYNDLKDKTNAAIQFEAALKESPGFELAKNNLDVVKAADGVKK